MNPFLPAWAARRYGESRPRVHRGMLEPLRALRGAGPLASRALDLGCGTGLSSEALSDHARAVVAVDISREMLRAAESRARVHYAAARAEMLPFCADAFDLATLGCVLHWCEPGIAFRELGRVLQEGALLVVYDNGFFGEMRENERAKVWLRESYPERYPAPPRGPRFEPDSPPRGFALEESTRVKAWVRFTRTELVRYLTTQSNVIEAVESGRETLGEVEEFLREGVRPFFGDIGSRAAHFRFGGPVHVLRRAESRHGPAR